MQSPHPFWHHLPPDRRTRTARWALKLQRLKAWLGGRRQRVCLTVVVYLLVWSMPLLVGQPVITVFALMPLLLVPPVGWLVYWLVWKEFHD